MQDFFTRFVGFVLAHVAFSFLSILSLSLSPPPPPLLAHLAFAPALAPSCLPPHSHTSYVLVISIITPTRTRRMAL
jgi:hypothetical protein